MSESTRGFEEDREPCGRPTATQTRRTGEEVMSRCMCLAVRKASRAVAQAYDEALAKAAITNGQFTLLAQIRLRERATISALARDLSLERTTLTRNLQLLEERGALTVAEGTDDKRKRVVTLTRGGERILARGLPHWALVQSRLRDALGRTGWDGVLDASRRLVAGLAPGPRIRRKVATGRDSPMARGSPGLLTPDQLDALRREMCMCTTLRRCARTISRPYDQCLRPMQMKISQFHILAAVGARPGTRIADLVETLTLDQTSLTRMLQRFSELGHVGQNVDGPSARGLVLTRSGERLLEKGMAGWRRAQGAIDEMLTPEFEAQARRMMHSVQAAALERVDAR